MAVEQVLVIPTRILHEAGLFQGLTTRVEHYLPRVLDPRHLSYLPRPRAEDDPSFKQIIPYVVMRHGDHVFQYLRGQGGGEKRLRSLRSIGVGGHINPQDNPLAGDNPYRQGMLREVAEEVYLESTYRETCLGMINDDATPVGQVHLGIVHVFDLAEPRVRRREQDVTEAGFSRISDLMNRKGEFETWSQFVMDALAAGQTA
jgi:predicted NUDIX family phosphoesterase